MPLITVWIPMLWTLVPASCFTCANEHMSITEVGNEDR